MFNAQKRKEYEKEITNFDCIVIDICNPPMCRRAIKELLDIQW